MEMSVIRHLGPEGINPFLGMPESRIQDMKLVEETL